MANASHRPNSAPSDDASASKQTLKRKIPSDELLDNFETLTVEKSKEEEILEDKFKELREQPGWKDWSHPDHEKVFAEHWDVFGRLCDIRTARERKQREAAAKRQRLSTAATCTRRGNMGCSAHVCDEELTSAAK